MTAPALDQTSATAQRTTRPPTAAPARADRYDASARDKLASALRVARVSTSAEGLDWTPHELCIAELLDAFGWFGTSDQLVEALPHVDPIDSLENMALVLRRLGFETRLAHRGVAALTEADFPAVCETKQGPVVALSHAQFAEDVSRAAAPTKAALRICTVTRAISETQTVANKGAAFTTRMFGYVRADLTGALALTALVNAFALVVPVYAISVYNLALPANALQSVLFFMLLALSALAVENYLRGVRADLISKIATLIHARAMREGVSKALQTPLGKLERVPAPLFVEQLRRIENVLSFFQSGNANTLIDAPFVVVFLLVICFWGGWLVLVPLAAIALFALHAVVATVLVRSQAGRANAARRRAKDLMRETVLQAPAIKEAGVESLWLDRLDECLDRDAACAAETEETTAATKCIGQGIIGVAAAATLGVGAYLVMQEMLSIGALMAATILNQRILGPVNAFVQSMDQLQDLREDIAVFEQVFASEDDPTQMSTGVHRRFKGALSVRRVGHRFADAPDFALRNVSFDIRPGERLALVGPTNSGKSLLLRVAVGLAPPTLGTVSLDGFSITQLNAGDRRWAFSYAPARPEFFYGTIAQNLRFVRADITDFEMEELLEAIGLPLYPEMFPEGLQTRLTESRRQELGATALQTLNIARTMLSDRPVLAFDNIFADLDAANRAAVFKRLDQTRERQSVLLVGAHRDVVQACDVTLALNNGAVVAYGPTQEVMAAITKS